MPEWNTAGVIALFAECADIARRIKTDPAIRIKDDRTPVSDADQGIEKLLTERIGAENLLGEETFPQRGHDALINQLLHGKIWIVDPIDGTANFVNRRPLWGISIGYAEGGTLVRGGIFLPEFGQMLITGGDGKAMFADCGHPWPTCDELKNALAPAEHPRRAFNEASCITLSQVMSKKGGFTGPHPVIAVGSCICSGMDLLLGRDAVYITNAKLWDMAGMLPCLASLGFYAADRRGLSVLDCRITPELFQLEAAAKKPFALQQTQWIGASREAVETVMSLCRN